jgi:hypothetical protein
MILQKAWLTSNGESSAVNLTAEERVRASGAEFVQTRAQPLQLHGGCLIQQHTLQNSCRIWQYSLSNNNKPADCQTATAEAGWWLYPNCLSVGWPGAAAGG